MRAVLLALAVVGVSPGRYLSAQEPKLKATLKQSGGLVSQITVSLDGKFLASGRGEVIVWDLRTDKRLRTWTGPGGLSSVAFSPDGKSLGCGHSERVLKPDGRAWTVEVREFRSGKRLKSFTGWSRDSLPDLAFSPDGRVLAIAVGDSIHLREVATWKARDVIPARGAEVGRIGFSPDGRTLFVGSVDKAACLWEVSTRRERARLRGHTGYVPVAAFSPDGKLLATASRDKTVRVWDLRTGTQRLLLNGHTDGVFSVAFALKGRMLASGSDDGTVRIWDLTTGKQVWLHKGGKGSKGIGENVWVAGSGDGMVLVTAEQDSGVIKVWDLSPLQKK
jgi:WD40 repeat protein